MRHALVPLLFVAVVLLAACTRNDTPAPAVAPPQASAPVYEVDVHPGIELLHVINYLARVYGPPVRDYDYRRDVDAWFGHLREHPAVVHARALPFNDFVDLGWALDPADLTLTRPQGFGHLGGLHPPEHLHRYLELAVDFARDSDFAGFYAAQRPNYTRWIEEFRSRVDAVDPLTPLHDFYAADDGKIPYFSLSPLGVVLKANVVIDIVAPAHAHLGPVLVPFDPRFLAPGDTDRVRFDYTDLQLDNAIWHELTHVALEVFAAPHRDALMDVRYADALRAQIDNFEDPRLNTYFYLHEVIADAVAIALKAERYGEAEAETHLAQNEDFGGALYRPLVTHLRADYMPTRAQTGFDTHIPVMVRFIEAQTPP